MEVCDLLKSNLSRCASQIASCSCNLNGVAAFFDEIRSMAATADAVKTVSERIAARPVVSVCLEIQAQYLTDLENITHRTCDCCCHYQAHPPRCQLSKRSVSPKQFSCKKCSPKYNLRK